VKAGIIADVNLERIDCNTGATQMLALFPGAGNTHVYPLSDEIPLEFRHGTKDGEYHLAHWR
jgi:hypothetical protein